MVWWILFIIVVLVIVFFVCLKSDSAVAGASSSYHISLDPEKSVYFNSSGGVSKIFIDGIPFSNPYKHLPRTITDEDSSKFRLLLSRTRAIKSAKQHLHGQQSLILTGYDNGGVTITSRSPDRINLEVRVYGNGVYMRSDSLSNYLPYSYPGIEIDKDGNLLHEDKKIAPERIPNLPYCFETYSYPGTGVKMCLPASFDYLNIYQ